MQGDVRRLPVDGDTALLIKRADVILWDEVVMCHRHAIEAVDRSLRDVMRTVSPRLAHVPFGGKVVVFGGDFRQILPVVQRGTAGQIAAASLRRSVQWQRIQQLPLTENMRVQTLQGGDAAEQQQFGDWLLQLGEGSLPAVAGAPPGSIRIPDAMAMRSGATPAMLPIRQQAAAQHNDFVTGVPCPVPLPSSLSGSQPEPSVGQSLIYVSHLTRVGDPEDLLRAVYGDLCNPDPARIAAGAVMAPTNRDVDNLNARAVAKFLARWVPTARGEQARVREQLDRRLQAQKVTGGGALQRPMGQCFRVHPTAAARSVGHTVTLP